jgi:CRP-like cAMP-binding protein
MVKQIKCVRGQLMCQEGKPVDKVFIIQHGAFEIYKTKKEERHDDGALSPTMMGTLLGAKHKKVDDSFLRLIKKPKIGADAKAKLKVIKLAQLSAGQVFGNDDLVQERNVFSATMRCIENGSIIYWINAVNFTQLFKTKWKDISKSTITKELDIKDRIRNFLIVNGEQEAGKKTVLKTHSHGLSENFRANY